MRPRAGSGSDLPGCLVLVACVVSVLLFAGCGAGALRIHATTALVAMTAQSIAADAYLEHLDGSLAECSGDAACLDREVAAHAPAEAALDLTRLAIRAYADGVALAAAADESGDVMAALVGAAMRLIALWPRLVEALAPLGVTLPALPFGGAP